MNPNSAEETAPEPPVWPRNEGAYTPGQALVVALIFLLWQLALGFGWGMAVVWLNRWPAVQAYGGISVASPYNAIAINTLACALTLWIEFRKTGPVGRVPAGWTFRSAVLIPPLLLLLAGEKVLASELDNLTRAVWPVPKAVAGFFGNLAGGGQPLGSFLLVVVVASVTEELIFRGLLLRGLLRTRRPVVAVIVSAALFAAIHLNPWQALNAFGLGLIFGWVYCRTRSLGWCIFLHALHNALPLYVTNHLPFVVRGFNERHAPGVVLFQPWWFNLAGLVLLAAGAGWFHRAAPAAPGAAAESRP